ncbi:DUF2625 domain-containing protein [Streptomyces spororaveus]|uniref:DUF2625 domain-containing protein n=1 Tax=Streptomyces spororaveus TaxID=284039 RepID=A0ABQ3T420_9ACTN|nr:DUF2625 domain-containing protein [Streptomyces spororaveus]MCM9077028.1 DUF2625 domain-containing protein [Streptomyces spororaveus]GHI75143.1 hypothetical protein Sspor_07040 [Streptomyces spororaveus]
MRTLNELIDIDGPAWPELSEELGAGAVPMEVLPADPALARASLLQLQVTARSYLGAMVLHCGGLLLDDGWLRVLGSPAADRSRGLPALAGANGFPTAFDPGWRPDAGLVVAYDALGGVFALNGARPADSGRPGGPGEMVYFAPDTLRWEALGAGHSAWLTWLLSGALDQFYADLRWPGWREEVAELNGDRGLSLHPPLWSAEGRRDVAATSRRAVPMAELLGIARETGRQFDGADPGFMGAV